MREIGAFEAKNRLGSLLDWVENGEEVVITRRGEAVARLVPAAAGADRAKAIQAAANVRTRSVGVPLQGQGIRQCRSS